MQKGITMIVLAALVCISAPANVSAARALADTQGAGKGKAVLYAALGEELSRYDVDVAGAALTKRGSVTLPANVQYAAANPSGRNLYVVSSNAGSGITGAAGDKHLLSAFRIDQVSGALQPIGQPAILPERPIHITLDRKGEHALVAFNKSATVQVYRITSDGAIGEQVAHPARPDGGIFTHQVRVVPSNQAVIVVGRGNEATKTKAEELGSLTTFRYNSGVLTQKDKITFDHERGPRHLDFHPSKYWVYVAMERGSKLFMYPLKDNTLDRTPLFEKETLLDLDNVTRIRQRGGVIHLHPNGRYLYVTNRADYTTKEGSQAVFAGGENNFAVFRINERTGEPTLVQHIDSSGIEPRTFAIDPSGQLLIAANQMTMTVRKGDSLTTVPSNLALFRIGTDGKLQYARRYEMEDGSKWLLWMNIIGLK